MTTLIVPAAGRSTRYGLSRPKFMLQHPEGLSMLAAGLKGIAEYSFEEIIVVSLEEYFQSINSESFLNEVQEVVNQKVHLVLLENSTSSMVDTINYGIEYMKKEDSLVIKDTDNFVLPQSASAFGDNFVTHATLSNFPKIKPANKSFIEFDSHGFLENIVEKKIISSEINTGLIGFKRASDFLRASSKIVHAREKFVSDVVRVLLENGEIFKAVPAKEFLDWGTIEDWLEYVKSFATIFVDLDGVLVENENPHGYPGQNWGRFRIIEENVSAILDGYQRGKFTIVFTTSRSEKYREQVQENLEKIGFSNCSLLMGLPHAQRILINDFAETNPFPSAIAINLERNARNLSKYLHF